MIKLQRADSYTDSSLTHVDIFLIAGALTCIMTTSLFAHEVGNWKLGGFTYQAFTADQIRGYACLAHSFGLAIGCLFIKLPKVGFAACMQTRIKQQAYWWITCTLMVGGIALLYLAQTALPPSPFSIVAAQLLTAATSITLIMSLSQFARNLDVRTVAFVIAGALVMSVVLVQGFFSCFATPPALLVLILIHCILIAASLVCVVCILKKPYLRRMLSHTGTTIHLKPSQTQTRISPVALLVAALASFAIALGFMHIIPLSIVAATLTHNLTYICGVVFGIALFLFLALRTNNITSTTIWDWLSRFAFPLTVTAALLVPLTMQDDFLPALILQSTALYYFDALLALGSCVVSKVIDAAPYRIFSGAFLVRSVGFCVGSIVAVALRQAHVAFDASVFSIIGVALFLMIALTTLNANALKYAKTAWGLIPHEDPHGLFNKKIETRCNEIAARYDLTTREKETLELLARNKSPKAIANELVVTMSTVRAHTQAIYKKLDIHSRSELEALLDGENH